MTDINDDDLILYLLDEVDEIERQKIQSALSADPILASRLQNLSETLVATEQWNYEADSGLEQRIWNQVEVGINSHSSEQQQNIQQSSKSGALTQILSWLQQPAIVFSVVAIAIAASFMSGRIFEHQEIMDNPQEMIASLDDEARNKILLQSVSVHLERTSRLMTTVKVSDQPTLVADEQQWAQQLLTSNRIFKVAARQAQQWRIVTLLEELEPLLIEMANSDSMDITSRSQISQRIDDNGLVFKTRNFSAINQPAI